MLRSTRAVLVVALVLTGACGSGASGGSSASDRPVRVLAAASLTEAFGELDGPSVQFSYGGSQALARQLRDGAPADVFASADERTMDALVADGVVATPVVFATNRLEIAVQPGNPKRITGLADLARSGLAVVLADPSVPVGAYARQALDRAGVVVRPRSLELDVKSALAKVTSGEADAAVVYVTDVRAAGAKAAGVPIPADDNVVARYPIAVVAGSRHRAAAQAFVRRVLGPDGRRALAHHGFGHA
jgi:molybdate transport system substrate-binding protein